ncbi:sodium:solute symporter family protein [Cuniculiplasma sp. SKW4]|uniref:sodium:solute symporter family protein n=1 Tax=Cuniculiplasma sp. SKW4 TaxID=3400171 RepID=UPI003FCF72E7
MSVNPFNDLDYALFFAVVIIALFIGFIAYLWRKPKTMEDIQEWGLGGRRFGTVVIWFLLGGDLYTAYTLIAVPGLAASSGALAMFAITYGIMIYPIVYATMPRLYNVSKKRGYITSSDYVKDRFDSRLLAMLIGLTGVVAELPYIALQIVSISFVLRAMFLPATITLIFAFALVAIFTFVSGLRGPALTAILKDAIIWIAVIAIVIYIPYKLGGFQPIFADASKYFAESPNASASTPLFESSTLGLGYTTLALGSALALFLYPHGVTGTLGSKDTKTIKRNASLLPLYNILLLMVAILGIAAVVVNNGVFSASNSSFAIPDLIKAEFPTLFTSFAYAAIVVGSVVPASIMAIASANLLTRNVYLEYINPNASSKTQSWLSRVLVLVVIAASLAFSLIKVASGDIVFLQTLGGAIVLQTLPAIYISLYTRKMSKYSVGLGWLAGIIAIIYGQYLINFSGKAFMPALYDFMYVGIFGLLVNILVILIIHGISMAMGKVKDEGIIDNQEFLMDQ